MNQNLKSKANVEASMKNTAKLFSICFAFKPKTEKKNTREAHFSTCIVVLGKKKKKQFLDRDFASEI